jgi:benzoate-CoA ligase
MELSRADHSQIPPRIDIPRNFNAAHDLLERNLRAGRGDKLAYIDDRGRCTYAELAARVNRAANALLGLGLLPEQRIVLALHDTIDFPTVFSGRSRRESFDRHQHAADRERLSLHPQ